MIISRTPYRLSLFGGGTDFPVWYTRHKGAVIATTINKYLYLTCRYLPPFFEHRYRVVWSKIENVKEIHEITHPAVRAVLSELGFERGVEIHADGDLPARSGIGSSSTFTVGMLNAAASLQGITLSKHELAKRAIHIEQNVLKETVGSQDQVSAAYGGLNRIDFDTNGEIVVTPLTVSKTRVQELNAHLMLFYTGVKRPDLDIQAPFIAKLEAKHRELTIMQDLVEEGVSLLCGESDIMDFGTLFQEAWDIKRGFSPLVSNSEIDSIHAEAIRAGAVGGKLTGAGAGGFLLLFVPPEKQSSVRSALSKFLHVPFTLDFSGSRIIFSQPATDDRQIEWESFQEVSPPE